MVLFICIYDNIYGKQYRTTQNNLLENLADIYLTSKEMDKNSAKLTSLNHTSVHHCSM